MRRSPVFSCSLLAVTVALLGQPTTLAAQGCCRAADLPMAAPEDVGMSSQRLQRLTDMLQGYIDRNEVVGTVMLVARQGKIVHFEAQGLRDREAREPMTTDAIFRIASMTKPITSVALMMLWEEGHFQLRDPVSKWIPEYAEMRVAAGTNSDGSMRTVALETPVTVQHLLTHTAGIANQYRGQSREAALALRTPRPLTLEESVLRFTQLPLNFQPGEAWEYGTATDVVGVLVEKISGMTLDEFFRERIFEPLGMPDTHYYLRPEKLHRFAALYGPDDAGKAALTEAPDANSEFVREPHTLFLGRGGLVSTAADYFRFQQMMLNGGSLDGVRILGTKTVELMTVNHIGDLPVWLLGPGYGFGLGYAVVTDLGQSGSSLSHGSFFWGGAYATTFWVDPVEELIGIMLVQIRPYNHLNIRSDARTTTYQAIIN